MKIVGICKTFRGKEFALATLDSVYQHIDKMIYVHGATDWLGRPGNNVKEVIAAAADPDHKILNLDSKPGDDQTRQCDVAIEYLLSNGIDFDYVFLSDTDEVFTEETWAAVNGELETNLRSKSPTLAFRVQLHTYIKSPFYQITPPVTLTPITFIHRSAIKPGIIGIRGSTLHPVSKTIAKAWVHHYCSVRNSLNEVWPKHETSCGSEKEPVCDKAEWVRTVWNRLPNAINCLPLKKYTSLWAGVKVIPLSEVPPAVQKMDLTQAWARYQPIVPFGKKPPVVITSADLMRNNLPPDFSPAHKLYKFSSFRTRYLRLLTGYQTPAPKTAVNGPAIESLPISPPSRTPVVGAPPTAPAVAKKQNSGTLCVTTIISGEYQWYVPLFIYCVKKALPDAAVLIYTRGSIDLPDAWKSCCVPVDDPGPLDGYTTAAMRFVHSTPELEGYDFTLITDIDILMMPERTWLVDQHMRTLGKHDLECYDNYVSTNSTSEKKVPGVHFVTKAWWRRTADARAKYRGILEASGSPSWEFDEIMLYRIIQESTLPEPPKLPNLWAHHGIHLGDWRRRIQTKNKTLIRPQADKYQFVQSLVGDRAFMDILTACSGKLPILGDIFTAFKRMYYL